MSGTVSFSNSKTIPAADASCSTVVAQASYLNYSTRSDCIAVSCSTDPVDIGSSVYWACTGSALPAWSVVGVSAPPESPFVLSVSDGALIASAILLVWATAWSFKALSAAINGGSPER